MPTLANLLGMKTSSFSQSSHTHYTRDAGETIKAQWQFPQDILSLLLILGPDVIWRALAQLVGQRVTPVVFSYGWVAYAVNALVAAFGDGHLMPRPDYDVLVVGAKSGHVRTNRSWVLGRLLHDHEERQGKSARPLIKGDPGYEALRVSVFQVDNKKKPGTPTKDWLWYSGFGVMLLQMLLSLVPWCVSGDWTPLVITLAGNFLALLQGAIPQWRDEKWACPTSGGWTTSFTRGNGSRHVMVVLANNHGFDLEILAGHSQPTRSSAMVRTFLFVMAMCWLVLLVSVAGLTDNTWYLLAVGLIGMIHNLAVAGATRNPSSQGIHLSLVDTISDISVSKVLQATESRYPMVGSSLVHIFFPGGMRVKGAEKEFWIQAQQQRKSQGLSKLAIKLD
ncbi:hypothetical protein PG993_011552 [Apiospora rasikravindrae]|uniref:Uncharacterized protein n=1 Tax=Apiospora rasikravindrae TaxID=990691 RepID=A0ABR1SEI7_9PEZI